MFANARILHFGRSSLAHSTLFLPSTLFSLYITDKNTWASPRLASPPQNYLSPSHQNIRSNICLLNPSAYPQTTNFIDPLPLIIIIIIIRNGVSEECWDCRHGYLLPSYLYSAGLFIRFIYYYLLWLITDFERNIVLIVFFWSLS